MLKFKINKDKSDERFEFMECEIENGYITIIKPLESPFPMCSVFIKRKAFNDNWSELWYVEIANHEATNYEEAKEIAEKIYETIYDFNLKIKWSEQ